MEIIEFADLIDRQITLTYYPNQDTRWSARFDLCEVKEGSMLAGVYGNGKSPELALKDYAEKISNKKIVFNAMGKERRQEYATKNIVHTIYVF